MPRKVFTLPLALLAALALPAAAAARQGVTFERSKVLPTNGTVYWKTPPAAVPVRLGAGAAVPVSHPGAQKMRVHFKAVAPPADRTWMVEVLDADDDVLWAYTPRPGEESFWSGDVPAQGARVRVVSTRPDAPAQVSVDAVAVQEPPPPAPQSIHGGEQFEDIGDQPAEVKALGRSVARIRFIGDDRKLYACTGFLVSADLLMTNQHCPRSEPEWRSALVDFDFDTRNAVPLTTIFQQFVMASAELDLALFRLAGRLPGRTPLRLDPTAPLLNQSLLVIQHPAGEHKQVSVIGCRVSGIPLRGVTPALTDFGHECDTLGGSSGSGILGVASRTVVGLHHLGYEERDEINVNRAVLMRDVIAFIRANRPDIAAELGLP